jgi:hypothetical protein
LCVPLIVFDLKGIPGRRRERIEAAVVAGGRHASGPHEAWIAADPFRGRVKVLITGPARVPADDDVRARDDPGVIA